MTPTIQRAVTSSPATALCVVSVDDAVSPALAGHHGGRYTSPPQPRDQALALARMLLGHPTADVTDAPQTWAASIAGGRRTITITTAA